MKVNDLVKRAHQRAKDAGWWDPAKSPVECHMLMVSELAEATEEVRVANPDIYISDKGKPEGEAVELADCIIRIADYFGYKGWDLEQILISKMDYNDTRPHRHGNKKY
jgi:NTP pyrophosphatase (non-canonical NTP hydrolase)